MSNTPHWVRNILRLIYYLAKFWSTSGDFLCYGSYWKLWQSSDQTIWSHWARRQNVVLCVDHNIVSMRNFRRVKKSDKAGVGATYNVLLLPFMPIKIKTAIYWTNNFTWHFRFSFRDANIEEECQLGLFLNICQCWAIFVKGKFYTFYPSWQSHTLYMFKITTKTE